MSPFFSFPRDSLGAESPEPTVAQQSVSAGQPRPDFRVRHALQNAAFTDAELAEYRDFCEIKRRDAAYRFHLTSDPADLREAVAWQEQEWHVSVLQNKRVRAAFGLRAAQTPAEDGIDYFQAQAGGA